MNEESAGHVAVNVLQGGWDAIGSMLAIQLVKWWCRVQGVFRADSAEAFTSTLLRWPSTLKCIATRRPASYVTPLSVVEPTCDVTCVWNITCNGKKRSRSSAARKTNWTRKILFERIERHCFSLRPGFPTFFFFFFFFFFVRLKQFLLFLSSRHFSFPFLSFFLSFHSLVRSFSPCIGCSSSMCQLAFLVR